MKLNQDYVKSSDAYEEIEKKRDHEALQELYRQLTYMERSISQHKIKTGKDEDRTYNDIKKKTKENTQLIVDLNSIYFEDKKQTIALKKKENERALLDQQLTRLRKTEAIVRQEMTVL